jgi:hypothetical protein
VRDEGSVSNLSLIVPLGTQIVLRVPVYVHSVQAECARGSVAEIVRTPDDGRHSYRAKRVDGVEFSVRRQEFSILKQVKARPLGDAAHLLCGVRRLQKRDLSLCCWFASLRIESGHF